MCGGRHSDGTSVRPPARCQEGREGPTIGGTPPQLTDSDVRGSEAAPDDKGGQEGETLGAVGGPNTNECVHDRDGVCTLHGEGALKLWRRTSRMVRGTRRGGGQDLEICK